MHTKSLEDLTGLVCSFESPTSPTSPTCQFYLAWWTKGDLSLLVLDGTYLDPDGVILDGSQVCPGRPRGLELENEAWRETPHNQGLHYSES